MIGEGMCGLATIVFIYWLGGIWMPEHRPILQEVIKKEGEE